MQSSRRGRFPIFPAIGGLLLVGVVTLAGCGGTPTPTATPEDATATAERNKSMEDYMKSAAGKKATTAKP
jgi:hypothetical protein